MTRRIEKSCEQCGKTFSTNRSRIRTCSRSCAGVLREVRKHGEAPERILRAKARNRWRNMIQRCTNPASNSWSRYGGRGIKVCPQWLTSFDAYYADVGDAPGPGYSLDRIDNDGDYELTNVRWATASEQQQNTAVAQRETCARGHLLDESNTHAIPGTKARKCRECHRQAAARSRARLRAKNQEAK